MDPLKLFEAGQAQQESAYKDYQTAETNRRLLEQQASLERQRAHQAALAEQNAMRQAARDQASNEFRDQNLERQQARDYMSQMMQGQRSYADIMSGYEDYVGSYQKRLDALGQDLDRLAKFQVPTDQNMLNKLYQEEQYYRNIIAPGLSKLGNITELDAAVNQILGKKPPVHPEQLKAIIAPTWQALQAAGIKDSDVIKTELEKALIADVQRRNPQRTNQEIQQRIQEINAERNRIYAAMRRAAPSNKMMSPQEYMAMFYGPFAMMAQGADPSSLSPPRASKKQHYATGMAMIGSFKDGRPVHIRPESFGGTVTSEDGRVQIVPSKHATISDALRIEQLNSQGAKILTQPVIEDDIDIPLSQPKAESARVPKVGEAVAGQKDAAQRQAISQVQEELESSLDEIAKKLGGAVAEIKKNPLQVQNAYDQVLSTLHQFSVAIAQSPQWQLIPGLTPQVVFQKLSERLPQYGLKPIVGKENSLSSLRHMGDTYRDFETQYLNKLRSKPSNELAEAARNHAWMRGSWVVPQNFDDLNQYLADVDAAQARK